MEQYTQIQFIDTIGQVGPQGIIDVDTNTQFPINFAISDITDPFSRKGVKSYKFKIVGTKEINNLLNNYFDINIVDGTYNHNHKQKVVILRNGIIILDNAYLQLLGINKISNNDVYSDQLVSYDVEVGNDVTSFFTDITNKYLSDLNFQDMQHTYGTTSVVDTFGWTDGIRDNIVGKGGYKYILPYIKPSLTGVLPVSTGTQYQLEECRPAISVYEYWNRIHQAAGYQWTWADFDNDNTRMDRLYIPYNGDVPKLSPEVLSINEVAADNSAPLVFVTSGGDPREIPRQQFIVDNEVQDFALLYDPITGIYTSAFYTGGATIDITFEVTYELSLNNPTGSDVYLTTPGIGSTTQNMRYRGSIDTINNTAAAAGLPRSAFAESANTIFLEKYFYTSAAVPFSLPSGDTVVLTGTTQTATLPVAHILFADEIVTRLALKRTDSGVEFHTAWSGGTMVVVEPTLTITSIKMIIVPRVDTYGYSTVIDMNDFVPAKIKQSDFIKSIANMYNLVMDIDPANEKNIVYTKRDDYYDAGIEKDWTSKVVTDKESIINFISNTNSKKIILSYTEDKDVANIQYQSATKEIYGQLEYTLENDNIKGLNEKKIVFSPTPIAQTSFGSVNPIWNGKAPKTNIRILLDGGETACGAYDIIDYGYGTGAATSISGLGLTTYPMLTHFDNPINPMFDINFGVCDMYFYEFDSDTNNNLYSMFWRRTISQIDNGKLLTAYFYLNEYDISILKLNDKIWIKDTWYNINSLQYDPNSSGPTKVQLMTIDDLLKLDTTRDRPGSYSLGVGTSNAVLNTVDAIRKDGLNYNYADSSVLILGVGNVVTADTKNVLLIGNNKINIDSNTIYTNNLEADSIILNGINLADNIRIIDSVQTVDATTTLLTGFEIEDDKMITIEGRVNGLKDDFTEAIGVWYFAVFRKTGGTIVQVGTEQLISRNDFSFNPVVNLLTDGTLVIIEVKGAAATIINWINSYEYTII